MRELKFRVFKTKMIYFGFRHIDEGTVINDMGMACIECSEDYEHKVMQYTGLKHLWESDIIRDGIGVGVVEYVEKYAGFRINYKNGRAKWFYDYLDSEWKGFEIIGNIHENPELLK